MRKRRPPGEKLGSSVGGGQTTQTPKQTKLYECKQELPQFQRESRWKLTEPAEARRKLRDFKTNDWKSCPLLLTPAGAREVFVLLCGGLFRCHLWTNSREFQRSPAVTLLMEPSTIIYFSRLSVKTTAGGKPSRWSCVSVRDGSRQARRTSWKCTFVARQRW